MKVVNTKMSFENRWAHLCNGKGQTVPWLHVPIEDTAANTNCIFQFIHNRKLVWKLTNSCTWLYSKDLILKAPKVFTVFVFLNNGYLN